MKYAVEIFIGIMVLALIAQNYTGHATVTVLLLLASKASFILGELTRIRQLMEKSQDHENKSKVPHQD